MQNIRFRTKVQREPLYRVVADACRAARQCNEEWAEKHMEAIEYIEENFLPYGSGFDSGCSIDVEESGTHKLVVDVPYHVMDEGGYRGWMDMRCEITPKLGIPGYDVEVTHVDLDRLGDPELYDELLEEYLLDNVARAMEKPLPRYMNTWMEAEVPEVVKKVGPTREIKELMIKLDNGLARTVLKDCIGSRIDADVDLGDVSRNGLDWSVPVNGQIKSDEGQTDHCVFLHLKVEIKWDDVRVLGKFRLEVCEPPSRVISSRELEDPHFNVKDPFQMESKWREFERDTYGQGHIATDITQEFTQ